jgi:DNA-binding MarR family transcriptional regulator
MTTNDFEKIIQRYEDVSFRVNRRMNVLLRECIDEDLTLDQFTALRYIGLRGAVTSSEIADSFCIGKSSVTAIINRLVEKQYVTRTNDPDDRRVTYLSLTEQGEVIKDALQDRIHRLIASFLIHFKGEEAENFLATYEKLADVVERMEGSD